MEDVETTPSGAQVIDKEAVEQLRGSFKGALLSPGDAGYDEARTVWNAMIDKRPALIARCNETSDVVAAVNFARATDLIVSIRGGGHNVAGSAVCEGGVMIDLSPMKQIKVDSVQRTARVEPGVTWAELDSATQAHGLATPGGTVAETGVAGLTLGGGVGWLMALHGLTCDNLLSAQVVLADGRTLTASSAENPALFWALRGGGGNFGIVTSFEFALHRVGPTLVGGIAVYPIEQAKAVLHFYREFSATPQDELTVYALLASEDGMPVVVLFVGWFGPLEKAEQVLAPLRSFGTPLVDTIQPISYTQLQCLLSSNYGFHRYWKSGYFGELSDEMLDEVIANFALKSSPRSVMAFFRLHGTGARLAADATAYYHRRTQWEFDIFAEWDEPATAQEHIAWVRSAWEAVAPFSQGVYVNHMDKDEGARMRAAYGSNYDRLAIIKRQYDPTNFFRLNQNIAPAP